MRVIRSAGQNVSPSDDGRLYDQAFDDGLFADAAITHLGTNNVAIGALYGIICGRDFTAEAQTVQVELPESDTATGYIYVEIDTSSDDVITIGSALAPFTPTYEDINTNGAVVQMIIAEYAASAVAVTSIDAVYPTASVSAGKSIAVIETSPTKASHAQGTYIVYDGLLYEVTAAISSGEALVVGTNISRTTVGDELTQLNGSLMNVETFPISSESLGAGTYVVKPLNVSNTSKIICATYLNANTAYNDHLIPTFKLSGTTFAVTFLNTSSGTADIKGTVKVILSR